MYMSDTLGRSFGLTLGDATINVLMHDENVGALMLIEMLPPQFTPHSKHYSTKTI